MHGYHGLMLINKKSKQQVPPYTRLALIYDFIMNHVNYFRWADFIDSLCESVSPKPQSILDISCGTGSFILQMKKRGYQTFGCDYSSDMVRIAGKKAGNMNHDTFFWCADMCHLGTCRTFDVVVSLYDSMNYLMSEQQWKCCFDAVYRALRPGGAYIFDISTISNSQHYFDHFVQKEKNDQISYVRRSTFYSNARIQENLFEISFQEVPDITFVEKHRQRIRSMDEVKALLKSTSFHVEGIFDGFSFRPGNEESERIHYFLVKPKS